MKLCPSCKNGVQGEPKHCSVCTADLSTVPVVDGDGLAGMQVADGRYELVEVLGEGGMAWVYRALHLLLDRDVAVKLLKPSSSEMQEQYTLRFEREARLASRLNHPHIVSTIDFGRTEAGLMYLVTEFIKGKPLHRVIWEAKQLPFSRAVDIFHQVLAAMDEAHDIGVIHRDIKPENIVVNQLRSGEDFVKVLDFGIAVAVGRTEGRVTEAGSFVGTPGFMSPEQIMCKDATERSDIYALGALLYELLTGRPMFDDEAPMALMQTQLAGKYLPLAEVAKGNPELAVFDPVIDRATARNPEDRHGSIAELREHFLSSIAGIREVHFGCQQCSKPVDPATGLCHLHRGKKSSDLVSIDTSVREVVESFMPEQPTEQSSGRISGAVLKSSNIVGRNRELEEIAAFLSGEDKVLILSGPPGIGKSTLSNRVATASEELGQVALFRTSADPRRALSPWYPVRRIVGEALGCGPEPSHAVWTDRNSGFANGKPATRIGLNLLFGFADNDAPPDYSKRRDYIHVAATKVLLRAVNKQSGPWIIAEDLHEYDHASLNFFRALGGLARKTALKLIATTLHDSGGFAGAHQTLELAPLSPDAMEELMSQVLSNHSRNNESSELLASAAGNPAYVFELQRLTSDGANTNGKYGELLGARLRGLPDDARELFQSIAILGHDVELDRLRSIHGQEQVFLELEILHRRGFILPSEGWVSVVNPDMGEAALEMMTEEGRKGLVARILERTSEVEDGVFLLARLSIEAGALERAAVLLEKAGDLACANNDSATAAMVHFRKAAHMIRWDLLVSEEDERYLKVALKMGKALTVAGHRKSALLVYKEVLALSGKHPDLNTKAQEHLESL